MRWMFDFDAFMDWAKPPAESGGTSQPGGGGPHDSHTRSLDPQHLLGRSGASDRLGLAAEAGGAGDTSGAVTHDFRHRTHEEAP